jgi:hypothetical protein
MRERLLKEEVDLLRGGRGDGDEEIGGNRNKGGQAQRPNG